MSAATTTEPDWQFALGVACFEAYTARTGAGYVPREHVERVTPEILRRAADILEEEEAQAQKRSTP